jgi:hypothetical protein
MGNLPAAGTAPGEAAYHQSKADARRSIIDAGGAMVPLIIILVILWALGIITKTTLGGFLHILLVVAIIFLLIRIIRGRPV